MWDKNACVKYICTRPTLCVEYQWRHKVHCCITFLFRFYECHLWSLPGVVVETIYLGRFAKGRSRFKSRYMVALKSPYATAILSIMLQLRWILLVRITQCSLHLLNWDAQQFSPLMTKRRRVRGHANLRKTLREE